MEALVAYYRKYESDGARFHRAVDARAAGARDAGSFNGRRTDRASADVPMAQAAAAVPPRARRPLTFTQDGRRHAVLHRAPALRASTRCTRRASTAASGSSARTRPTSRTARVRPRPTFNAGDLVRVTLTLRPHEGAPVRRRHRSAARPASSRSNRGSRRRRRRSRRSRMTRARPTSGVAGVVAARRVRPRRAARRPGRAVRHAPRRGRAHLHLRRPRDDLGHVPHGAGARRGDVRARGVRTHRTRP